MPEETSSGIPVRDRRTVTRSDSSPADTTETAAADVPPDTASTQTEPAPATSAQTEPEIPITEPGDAPDAPEGPHSHLPDPTMLLSMAAMQMETPVLATALLSIFDGHAWQAMGLIAHPLIGDMRTDLPAAQLAIDCVAFLLGKVEGCLSEAERREAQRRLSDLRMNYLARRRDAS